MKKSTLEAMRNYLNGETVDVETLKAEVNAEWERTTAKSRANAELYDAAHEALMGAEGWDKPLTVKELWEVVAGVMPDGFTQSKMQYALLNYWNSEVTKHEDGKNAYKYSKN